MMVQKLPLKKNLIIIQDLVVNVAKSKKEIISIKSISKIYHLGTNVVKALDDVSVNIYENDFISIMGPSGSGKSTLMNIIGCLDVPTKGTYKFNKALISEMNDSQLANIRNEKIGFVFQTFNLLPKLNALQNVEVPLIYSSLNRTKRTQRAKEALKIAGDICVFTNQNIVTEELSTKHWDWVMNTNARGPWISSIMASKLMKNGGSIINISSLGSQKVLSNYFSVGVSKSALESITRYLSIELAKKDIRVNTISPGIIKTDAIN